MTGDSIICNLVLFSKNMHREVAHFFCGQYHFSGSDMSLPDLFAVMQWSRTCLSEDFALQHKIY